MGRRWPRWRRGDRGSWLLALIPVAAAQDLGLVAVLELDGRSNRLSLDDVQYVTDAVRKAAADGLDLSRYTVMTRETMDIIVPPEQRKCLNDKC